MSNFVRCSRCGKQVSNALPLDLIVRAWVECPECVETSPDEADNAEACLRNWVKSDPAHVMAVLASAGNEKLQAAAKKVVDTRYGSHSWEELNEAVSELGSLLKSQGVTCKGIH